MGGSLTLTASLREALARTAQSKMTDKVNVQWLIEGVPVAILPIQAVSAIDAERTVSVPTKE